MDSLEEQLAQLQMFNSESAESCINIQQNINNCDLKNAKSSGKVSTLVPQSSLVKLACEPLYSKRLLCTSDNYSSTMTSSNICFNSTLVPHPSTLQRKQSSYTDTKYDKTSKVTLDNPDILDQQLEALAYHKMQLEKNGLLQPKNQERNLKTSYIPKLSSISLMTDLRPNETHPTTMYSNVLPMAKKNILYNDCEQTEETVHNALIELKPTVYSSCRKNIYINVPYQKNNSDILSAADVLSKDTAGSSKCLRNNSNDDILPPPSPVSSSYSELRRATDIFSKNQNSMNLNSNKSTTKDDKYLRYEENVRHDAKKTMNAPIQKNCMHYNNEYNSYSPTLQSISQDSSDYYGYGSFSQGSSTYESIYEPINPRPASQLSSRSNNSYSNGPQIPEINNMLLTNSLRNTNIPKIGGTNSTSNIEIYSINCSPNDLTEALSKSDTNGKKEAEVKTLTDFLINSMDTTNDIDSYGICYKCKERVVGENSGCTAMEQIYHIICFTCTHCQINLQGKPFYTLEGNPFCEYDYFQTLEKCSVCMQPILERILRATGKPYHPQCFTCIVCSRSLDGIPFTVDATNLNYCIADFHKKFAPRCCVCKKPIMPEIGEEETVRVVALDRSFHFECYKCEDCGLLLSSEAEGRGCYPLDDHVLCKSCNAKRVQMLTNRMSTEL